MTYRPKRIISGGQTGADTGALLAGRDLGIRTGGWAPKGWITENGPNPVLNQFGLIQHSSPNYPPRTRMNCQDSDLTVIFGDVKSAGTRLTIDICKSDDIPYLLNPDSQELRTMCEDLNVRVLNVAGNRASKDAGIEERVRKIVREAFQV
jgi:WD40 repeat protein